MGNTQVVAQHFGKVSASFFEHRGLQNWIEAAELANIRRGKIDLVELQPLVGEALNEAF